MELTTRTTTALFRWHTPHDDYTPVTYPYDDDYHDARNIYFLHWVMTPIFFLLFLALAIACWYRRYKLRQQIIEQRRNHQQTMAVVGFNGINGVTIPPPGHHMDNIPSGAYPRQAFPPAYTAPAGPPAMHCPAYESVINNTNDAQPQVPTSGEQTQTAGDTVSPPSYDVAIKQPA